MNSVPHFAHRPRRPAISAGKPYFAPQLGHEISGVCGVTEAIGDAQPDYQRGRETFSIVLSLNHREMALVDL